jgi:hypothetical protein
MQYAKALAEASLLPNAYRKQPANVLLAIEYGDALGLSPMAAIQGIHIIDGKPTASAAMIGALVRRAGHRLRVQVNQQGTAAKATITRSDDPDFTFESVWTIERAQAAGLVGKGSWKAYPAAMLKARAITEVARDACPEVLSGVQYTAEELGADEAGSMQPDRGHTTAPDQHDPWVSQPAHVDPGTGEILEPDVVDAEVVDDYPAPSAAPVRGPLGRDIATRPASEKQIKFLDDLAKKAGHLDLAAYLDSAAAADVLGGTPSEPLTDGHARLLIDALKAEL